MGSTSRALRILAASALIAALGVPAVAAADPVAATLTLTVPAEPVPCRVETEVSVLVVDASGATIAGKVVTWSLMPVASSQDSIVDYTSTTGSQGVALTKVWIDCIRGPRTLHATADGATASVDLSIATAGMPTTSTDTPSDAPAGMGWLVAAALAAAALVCSGVAWRWRAARAD
jgi:hypothetical protein